MKLFLITIVFLFGVAHAEDRVLRHVEQIVSIFENSSIEPQYDYIEDIHDGRGFTAGKIGFTTATGDLVEVIKHYLAFPGKFQHEWNEYIPVLKKLAKEESDDTSEIQPLVKLWKKSCSDKYFIQAQDDISQEMYLLPAKEKMRQFHVKTDLALLVFYDTIVQHGSSESRDPDSFEGVIDLLPPSSFKKPEPEFLSDFLRARRKILMNANDPNTREVWRESVPRVDVLLKLLKNKTFNLSQSLHLRVWNQDFDLD